MAPSSGTINGVVTLDSQAAARLPEASEVHVQLIDASAPGSPAVADTRFDPAGQVPIPFTVAYDGAAIQSGHHYYIRAAILDKASGQPTFSTPDDVPVIPGMINALELVLQPSPAAEPAP